MPSVSFPQHDGLAVIEPSILYFGTPVALIGTRNEDGTPNLAPMSSVWWLGWRAVLGLAIASKTPQNMIRTGECVINLPSDDMADAVDRIARTTGSNPVPPGKVSRGYRYEKQKFETAGLTAINGEAVAAPRVLECPVQLEARLESVHEMAALDPVWAGRVRAFEMRIVRVHADRSILMDGEANRIDPDKWRPLIMSFQQFYGLAPGKLHHSKLGEIPEQSYRPPNARMG
ncbi:flavin reductase [Pseudolabrys sp. Root1462]|uniref:flavin reductase family protein n=1 Tax=Pseudolabrys sp. Root1462 TaxID=1736466 RepID=UPI000702BEB1|nr:flavin reductase family protein [Pseudolabrys sp. Root1462]KQY97419.1 flavin reductase [Pseudolabrys sp. Root1462]